MAEKPVGIVTARKGLVTALVLVLTKHCKWASEVPWTGSHHFGMNLLLLSYSNGVLTLEMH